MQQEPSLRIALTLHSNPGAYALLVGSGLSSSAGILTGWGIVEDLAGRLAVASGSTPENRISWYEETFGEEADYGRLLRRVGLTAADRRALLREYFEPSEEDREAGRKVPTAAHNAIAELARLGYVRMILTTNFDTLIEQALVQVGVTPTVLSTADAISGAPPYAHGGVYLVKLHGDYRDNRIRNTPRELSRYPRMVNRYLDRVLDDFGLVICGWSSDSDVALREALLRAPNRRFATYWLVKGRISEDADRLISHRKAEQFRISGAEAFFPDLVGMLQALRESERPDPISVAVAVASTKRYLSEERHEIQLHDLLRDETERVRREVASERFSMAAPTADADSITQRLRRYESVTQKLAAMMATIGYHGQQQYSRLLTRFLERLSPRDTPPGTSWPAWVEMQAYPALLLIYAAGIPALAARRFSHLAAVLLRPRIQFGSCKGMPLITAANPRHALEEARIALPKQGPKRSRGSEYLATVLEPVLEPFVPGHEEFLAAFDTFEYFLSLVYWRTARRGREWAPMGVFVSRRFLSDSEDPLFADFLDGAEREGDAWGIYEAGLFDDPKDLHQVAVELWNCLRTEVQGGLWAI